MVKENYRIYGGMVDGYGLNFGDIGLVKQGDIVQGQTSELLLCNLVNRANAAPELLEACKDLLAALESARIQIAESGQAEKTTHYDEIVIASQAAIASAESK